MWKIPSGDPVGLPLTRRRCNSTGFWISVIKSLRKGKKERKKEKKKERKDDSILLNNNKI